MTSCGILAFIMKIFKFLTSGKNKKRKLLDYYQESINRTGREQFKKLVEKGLSVPVALL